MPQGEPLELQLQRERVARTQVEALLESTRLQLIEMEIALRKAREEATRCLTTAAAATSAVAPAPAPMAQKAAVAAPSAPSGGASPVTDSAPTAPSSAPSNQSPAPAAKPISPKPRVRRAPAKLSTSSLVEAARAAEAIEKASRESSAVLAPAGGMFNGRGSQALISTLDLNRDDNRAVVIDFIQHLQTRLSKMQACYGSGNTTELKWHASWIKDNASPVGFEAIGTPAAALEAALEAGEMDRVPTLLDNLTHLAERAVVEPARSAR